MGDRMDYLRQYIGKEGSLSLTAGKELTYIEFGIVNLKAGSSFQQEKDEGKETGLILLKGKGKIEAGEKVWEIEREDVFSQRAFGVYIPPGISWRVEAEKPLELAVARTLSKKRGEPVLISPEMVKKEIRGKQGFRREVYNIIDEKIDAEKLVIGETINFPGEWSSFPPHKQELDEAYVIKNNSFLLIPKGYHPIAVIPGYRLYYLWVLAGKKRKLVVSEDTAYNWISKKSS
jgi:5-deoxy-glucuronate isomerase